MAALIVMLGSASVLLGWAVDPALLRALTPGRETMKPLGALGLLCGAAALLLLRPQDRPAAPWRRPAGLACAAVIFVIGSLALVEQGLQLDLGIDRLLFPGALSGEGPHPGRPVFPISLCLALLGLALVPMRSRLARAADLLVAVVLFLGLLVLVGYLYDAVPLYSVEPQRPVPVVAAVLVVVLATGCLAARPHSPLLATVTSPRGGGIAARRLLPAAILLPLVLGLLRLAGQRVGLYDTEIGLALFAMLNMAVFVALVYSSASRLNEADASREAVHAALLESEESFRRLLDATPSGFIMVAEDGRIAAANATAEALFGYEAGRLAGRGVEELVPERFRARHPALREAFEAGERPLFLGGGRDLVARRRDGVEFPVEIGLSSVEMPQGRFTVASVVDVTDRKRAADEIRSLNATLERRVAERTEQLEFERARWRGIVEGIADEVWMCDVQGRMSLLNLPRVTGLGLDAPREETAGGLCRSLEILSADGGERPTEDMPLLRSLRGEVVHGEEILRERQTGRERNRQYSSAPMRDAAGRITGAVAIVRDVTDQKRAEEGLRRFELLATHGKDIVLFVRRADGRVLEANTAAVRAYGYTREELLALTIRDLRAPETRDLTAEQMARADAGGLLFETVHRRKDGTTFPVEVSSQGATIGGVRTLISIVRDVTERRQAQAQLSAALEHKEALLKEIHHRVKNNMQVVSSLLRLQSDALPDPRIREVLAESQRRVRAMALLHEQLYRSSDLARIDFGEYVVSLVSYLRRSFASVHPEVEIRVEVQGVLLEMERAMPLGLLVSELVANSLKHAFPPEAGTTPHHVWVVARREAPCGLTLTVGDDGVGLPEAVDLESSPSMGLKLVKSFADQLRGRLVVDRDPGTVVTVTVPEKGD